MIQDLKFIIRVVPRGFLYSTIDKLFNDFNRLRIANDSAFKIVDDWKIVRNKDFILRSNKRTIIPEYYSNKELSLSNIISEIISKNLTNIDLDERAAYLFELKFLEDDNEYKLLESSVHNILEDTSFDNSFIKEYLRTGKFFDLSKIGLRFIVDRKCFA